MNEQQQETLSALFDGETSEFETRRLLNELNEEQRSRWQRYQMIREASSNNLAESDFSFNIVAAVSAAIEDEETPSLEQSSAATKHSWLKPVVGFAAAASIAFVAVLGIQDPDMVNPGFIADGNVSASQLPMSGDLGLTAVSGTAVAPSQILANDIQAIDVQKIQDAERLQHYLLQHTQHAAFNNGRGLMPMARIYNGEY